MVSKLKLGTRVVRGPDWKWENQDDHEVGVIVGEIEDDGWVRVKWQSSGVTNSYRLLCKLLYMF